jgi:hypothetical protein
MPAGIISLPSGLISSYLSQPSGARSYNLVHERELFFEVLCALSCDPIRLPARIPFDRPNPAALFETGYRAIQRSWAEPDARKCLDILHDCVAVFIRFGQAGEYEKCGVGHLLVRIT